eukprot:Nitzschia sp. Nitz4//scaffold8_size234185//118341//121948//NITZ4_001266-RA/size234185-snap-gene-0.16-mRNA-1//1//CDS//3329559833//9007//frame0
MKKDYPEAKAHAGGCTEDNSIATTDSRDGSVPPPSSAASWESRASYSTDQELQAILNASLQFQHDLEQRASFKFQRTSSTNMYPSIRSLSHPDNIIDLDQHWEAASRASHLKRSQNGSDRSIFSTADYLNGTAPDTTAGVAKLPAIYSPDVPRKKAAAVATSADDEELMAMKMAAYNGAAYDAPNVAARAFSRNPPRDDDMIQMKLAAYENRSNIHGNSAQLPAQAVQAQVVPSDASATMVDGDMVTGGVHAEPLHVQASVEGGEPIASAACIVGETIGNMDYADGVVHDATMTAIVEDLDSKPPARNPQTQENDNAWGQAAEATIVNYEVHPSDISVEAAEAVFVGQDFEATVEATESDNNNAIAHASPVGDNTVTAVFHADGEEIHNEADVTGVAILESDAVVEATVDGWDQHTDGEAQVLEEEASPLAVAFDSKPPDEGAIDAWNTDALGESTSEMNVGEAEVIGYTLEAHPAEFVDQGESAEAELIGSAFETAIAVPSVEQTQVAGAEASLENGEIVVEDISTSQSRPQMSTSTQPFPQEARAMIVTDSQGQQYTHSATDVTAVAAVVDNTRSTPRSVSEPAPTPVTILEDVPAESSATSFPEIVKPEPFSSRYVSAPPAVESVAGPGNWNMSPSVGGEASPPPMATVSATQVALPNPPPIPSPHPVAPTTSTASRSSRNSNNSCEPGVSVSGLNMLSSNIARGANNVMESLFGNVRASRRPKNLSGFDLDNMSGSVLPRTLLPSSVIYSEATNSWVATVNTNQKALEVNNVEESSKALRAFSVPTKKQAVALARAWAPPFMHPFGSNPMCFVCEAPFSVFRRPCHCRNCGVCVCNNCSMQWPSKMLPATYNIKKEGAVNICKACDWLCSAFRLALLHGEYDKAIALHSTGNINLTTPFANCAVLGGNLSLLQWLVDDHCCPLRSIRISNGKQRNSAGSYTPILTSKGRSLLGIALGNRNIGIVRYLVVEKRMLLSAEKNLSVETLVQNLDLVLRVLPEEILGEQGLDQSGRNTSGVGSSHSGADIDITTLGAAVLDDQAEGLGENECIICFDNPIDCVMTPCGHQICCLQCGNNISRCPVCQVECSPMRVFKP